PFRIQNQEFNTDFFKTLTRNIKDKQFIEHCVGSAFLNRNQDFSNDIISRKPVKTQNCKVQGELLDVGIRDSIECEGFIKNRVQRLPEHSGLHSVLLLCSGCSLQSRVNIRELLEGEITRQC
ncbi:mCG145819, partial [Mus musculus]